MKKQRFLNLEGEAKRQAGDLFANSISPEIIAVQDVQLRLRICLELDNMLLALAQAVRIGLDEEGASVSLVPSPVLIPHHSS